MTVRTRRASLGLLALCGTLFLAAPSATAQQPSTAKSHAVSTPAQKGAAPAPNAGRLNLNAATLSQLDALPGIGPKTAQRIIEYRQKNGGFKKIEELMNVRGVGEKGFLRIKDRIAVAPTKGAPKQQ
jgi:competence protein ComEA